MRNTNQSTLRRKTLTVREVADALGVCPQTVRNLVNAGRLPSVRVGLTIRIIAERLAEIYPDIFGPDRAA